MKKTFIFNTLFLFSAASALASPGNFAGAYVGGFGGARLAAVSELTTLSFPAFRLTESYPARSVCLRGGEGGILLGYGFHPSKETPFYMGIEAAYSRTFAKGGVNYRELPFYKFGLVTFLTGNMGLALSQQDAFSLGLRLGYTFKTSTSQFMPWIKIGIENTRFVTNLHMNNINIFNTFKLDLGTRKWNRNLCSPVVGVGTDFKLTDNLIVGWDFSYTYHQKTAENQIVTPLTGPQVGAINAAFLPAAAAAAAAAAAGGPAPGIPALGLVAGQQITTTVKTKVVMGRGIRVRIIWNI